MFKSQGIKSQLSLAAVILLFMLPTVVGLGLFQYFPLLTAVRNSLYDLNLLDPSHAIFVGIDNYLRMWEDERFHISLLNTLFYTTIKLIVQLPLALALALLVQRQIRGIGFVRSAIFAPTVTAVSIAAVIWNLMYDPQNGFFNAILQTLGLPPQPFLTSASQALPSIIAMSVWLDAGFTMLIFLSGLQGIPYDYYEAARIDGASNWNLFRYITLPLLSRTTLFAVVTTTIFAFKIFTPVYIMTKGGPLDSTLVAVYYIFEQGFVFLDMGYASTLAVVLILILLIVAGLQGLLLRSQFEY